MLPVVMIKNARSVPFFLNSISRKVVGKMLQKGSINQLRPSILDSVFGAAVAVIRDDAASFSVVVGIGIDGFGLEDHEHDGTGDDECTTQPRGGSHHFVPESPAEEDMKENFSVHQKGNDEGIDVLKRPCHEHLCRQCEEPQTYDKAPISPSRENPRFVSGYGKADENAENLEVKNDFRIGAKSFFGEAAYYDVGSG